MSAEWGAFVVACMPLIRREAARLRRRGVPLDVEDATQTITLWLLESEAVVKKDVVEVAVRRRFVDLLRKGARRKRSASLIPIDDTDLGVPSHENDVIDRVTAEQIAGLMPKSHGTRQARQRMEGRWLPKIRKYATRGAA